MAKRKRRSFPGEERPAPKNSWNKVHSDEPSGGVFGFFKDYSVRETFESFVIAILLALVFRAFEAEAFIIPTGSMAPSLQGQHKDLACAECGHQYRVGVAEGLPVAATTCPVCHFTTRMSKRDASHVTNNGDRILVNKFIYDFQEPERYDVIVFKNPNIAKENYIKRLIGLPGENILVENGDIYTMEKLKDGSYDKTIARKPSKKLLHMLELIADTRHRAHDLVVTEWPLQWQQRSGEANWKSSDGDGLTFTAGQSPEISWLRFRNNGPEDKDWANILEKSKNAEVFKSPPNFGRLINDYVAYNDFTIKGPNQAASGTLKVEGVSPKRPGSIKAFNKGLHWVGDIGFETELKIISGTGSLFFDIVEGGAHFQMAVDTQSGKLELSARPPETPVSDSVITFNDADGNPVDNPVAQTPITGPGSYQIRIINADDKIHLWVDGDLIDFDGCTYTRTDIPVPHYSEEDPGDAEPLGIGCQNLDVAIDRIKVFRDLYYISTIDSNYMTNETGINPVTIIETMRNPRRWSNEEVRKSLFLAKKGQTEPMFSLLDSDDPSKDRFLPMGDNSAQSLDGRVWPGPRYFERDLLIGRAIVVFWPHTLSKPIPYMPNFGRMTFIK